jgi:hypothetical protein
MNIVANNCDLRHFFHEDLAGERGETCLTPLVMHRLGLPQFGSKMGELLPTREVRFPENWRISR